MLLYYTSKALSSLSNLRWGCCKLVILPMHGQRFHLTATFKAFIYKNDSNNESFSQTNWGRDFWQEVFKLYHSLQPASQSRSWSSVTLKSGLAFSHSIGQCKVEGGEVWTLDWSETDPDISRNRSHASLELSVCLGLVSHMSDSLLPKRNVTLRIWNKQSWETGSY